MDNFQRINTNIIITECLLYSMLMGVCNCNLKYRWKNLTTNVTKTGLGWKTYFETNPPDCGSGGDALYGETVIGVAGTTITMVNIGTAFTIAWDNITHTTGWNQVGQTITLTDGSILGGGEIIKIIYTV
jgi:hypothetical protein